MIAKHHLSIYEPEYQFRSSQKHLPSVSSFKEIKFAMAHAKAFSVVGFIEGAAK